MIFRIWAPLLGGWRLDKVVQDNDQLVQASVNFLGLCRFVRRLQ